jgi:hypothetical protein
VVSGEAAADVRVFAGSIPELRVRGCGGRGTHSDRAYQIAEAFAFSGQPDEAFRWLNRAYDQRDVELYWIKHDPLLRNLERDNRYKVFLRRMNLPE